MHGATGIMNKKNGKAQCHLCGLWFLNVGLHVDRGHKMDCGDYREMFGLSRHHSLAGDDFITRQRENHSERLRTYKTTGMALIQAQSVEDKKRLRAIPRRESTRIKNSEARKREKSVERLQQSPNRIPALLEAKKRPEYRKRLSEAWGRRPDRDAHMKMMQEKRWRKRDGGKELQKN